MTLKLEMPTDQEGADQGTPDQEMILRVPTDRAERERWAVTLYDLGAVSRSRAAQIAGLPLSSFFKVLARESAAHFAATGAYKRDDSYTAEYLRAEVEAARL